MSDEVLRALERRWRETGSLEDEGAWLRERVRAGTLPRRTLEILAELGNSGPRVALGLSPDIEPIAPSEALDVFRERLAETIVWCESMSSKSGASAFRDPRLAVTLPPWLGEVWQSRRPSWAGAELAAWCEDVVRERRRLLVSIGWIEGTRASTLAGGRLLAYSPEVNTCDGVSPPASEGLLDNDNLAAWDTWTWFVPSRASTTLISWIPRSHMHLADAAVRGNAEDCIVWLYPPDANPPRNAWWSPEVADFAERLARSGLV